MVTNYVLYVHTEKNKSKDRAREAQQATRTVLFAKKKRHHRNFGVRWWLSRVKSGGLTFPSISP